LRGFFAFWDERLVRKVNIDATVPTAFLLNFADTNCANFTCGSNMGTTARL
jgi:hypothetical protein